MINVQANQCSQCHVCIENCPLGLLALDKESGLPSMESSYDSVCVRCGQCESACPTGALRVDPASSQPQKPLDKSLNISSQQIAHHMRGRRSIRRYQEKPVDKAVLESLMEIARHAPSGHNGQPLHWTLVYDMEETKRVTGIVMDWMRGLVKEKHPMAKQLNFALFVRAYEKGADPICRHAPHLVVVHADKNNTIAPTDAVIAMTYLELAAPAFDVGTCWAGYFKMAATLSPQLQQALGIPEGNTALGAMMLGYPKTKYYRYPERNAAKILWK